MNLDRVNERILYIVVLIGGILFAILCGMLAGGGQFNRLGLIFTIMTFVALSLILRAKIWLLIPLAWPLSASIPLMEWPFGVRDLAVLIVCASFLTLMGFKIIRAKPKTDLIDLLLLANVLYLCTVFVRNPVGLAAFNSEMVGGKPYFN